MIELRGLHLGNIARSRAESVRPDLWPDHAWVPALGCTGGVLYDLCGGMHGTLDLSCLEWVPGVGLRVGVSSNIGVINIGDVPAVGGYTFSAHSTATWTYHGGICSLLGREGSGTWTGHTDRLVLTYGRISLEAQVYGPLNSTYATGSTSVRTWAGATRAGGGGDIILADGVEVPGVGITGGVYDYITLRLFGGLYSSSIRIAAVGSTLSSFLFYGSWRPEVLSSLHTDPILPFRRRQPVFYSVPSGGGTTRNLIAALAGESATGTIAAIIARALTGDVTATSVTGAITASMVRDLLASLPGQSTTGDVAATLQRLLLASLGGASTTGDVAATMSGLVSLIAAINGQSATGTAAATQARALLADLQASSTTPDIAATLAALVALTANISGTTTTPAVAATMARALAANLAGQSTTGAIAVEFAGMLLLVASIAGTSTTGALTATTGRKLRAAIATASTTGQVDGQLLRKIAATIAGASLTGPIAAELVSLVSLAASVVGVSVSPAIIATLQRGLAADVAAGSTAGNASATVARTLAAAVDAGSLTPDNLVLILTGLGILHDTTIISRTPRRGITSRTVRRTIHSA